MRVVLTGPISAVADAVEAVDTVPNDRLEVDFDWGAPLTCG